MTARVLITGAEGFVGRALFDVLRREGWNVSAANLQLTDPASVDAALRQRDFDLLVHLAGLSHIPTCIKDPALARQVNTGGTASLLESLLRHQPQAHLIFASTAQVYAAPDAREVASGAVFEENRTIAPQNIYASTKWEAELLIQNAVMTRGLRATILRLFNHTHRTQSADFFLPHLYAELSKPGLDELNVKVGNLDLYRDIGSLCDLVPAINGVLRRIADRGGKTQPAEVFNVCSGTPKHLKKLAHILAARLGRNARFEVDPSRIRSGEARSLVGSHQRLTTATGWLPFCRTEEDLIEQFLA